MKLFKRSTQPASCPSCRTGVEPDQLSCLECGNMLSRRGRLSGAAWQLPVATVAAVFLLLATGIGYASGAVVQDGDVSVAEAPPTPAAPAAPGEEPSGQENDGGSDDLAQLDPPDAGDGGGSDLDAGDGDGDGGDDNDDGGDNDGGDGGDGDGDGGGSSGGDSSDGGAAPRSPDKAPEIVGREEPRELAEISAGENGFTVALLVTSSRSTAQREARAAVAEGRPGDIPAGVINRADFPGLPGAFVTFAGGPFDSRAEAERAAEGYATLGFTGEVIELGGGG